MNRALAIDVVLGWATTADIDAAESGDPGWPAVEVDEVLESLGVSLAEIHDAREREA